MLADGRPHRSVAHHGATVTLRDPLRSDGSGEWTTALALPDGNLLLAGSAGPKGVPATVEGAAQGDEPAGLPASAPAYGQINPALASELRPSGAPVTWFGHDGTVEFDAAGVGDPQNTTVTNALARRGDGEVVLAGTTTQAEDGAFCMRAGCPPGYTWLAELYPR
ncbi:MAG TPA: hypothetical protein VHX88_19355 [Solirubrobacteraceae bacterium]|jgi:hypothetical protein|nr:hypothetical protein [Solirubrobacteraceae bacterium]